MSLCLCLSPNGQMRYDAPVPPTQLFVATATGIEILARDGAGAPWRRSATALARHHVSTMTCLPGQDGIFAGTHGDGIFYSGDGGRTWEERDDGVTIRNIYTLAAIARDGGIALYAGTEPATLFRSLDLGKSWVELPAMRQVPETEQWTFPGPPHIAHTKMLAFDPRNPDLFYAAIEQGAFLKTRDGGKSWREFTGYSRPDDRAYRDIHQILLDPFHPDRVYMTTGVGLYRSEDGGESWERLTGAEFRLAYPDHLALSPDGTTLFMSGAATSPGAWRKSHNAETAIMRSRDGGRSWEHLQRGIPGSARCNIEAMSLVAYPGGFSLFVGNTDGDIYASEDGGDSWSRLASALGPVSKGNHFVPLREPGEERVAAR